MDNPQMPQQQPAQPVTPPDSLHLVKTLLISLVAVVVLSSIAAGAYFLGKNQTPAQTACTLEAKVCQDGTSVGRTGPKCEFAPCPTPTPDPTANWKTYNQSGYTIKYPLILSSSTDIYPGVDGQVQIDSFSNQDSSVSILSYSENVKPKLEFIAKTINESNIIVAGQSIKKIVGIERISDQGTLIHVGPLNNNGKNYMITFSTGSKKVKTEDLTVFDQILSTFKFTDSAKESSDSTLCIQVITPAKNNSTNECREFPTPCDVPSGWTKVASCTN